MLCSLQQHQNCTGIASITSTYPSWDLLLGVTWTQPAALGIVREVNFIPWLQDREVQKWDNKGS